MRILLAGGGTGGHLFPGLALARQLERECPGAVVSFIGTAHGLDLEIVPRSGYAIDILAAGRGSPFSLNHPLNAPRFFWSIAQSLRLFKHYKPDALVALGGFAGAAPGIAAKLYGIPVAVLEQNAVPGRVNRMLARWAERIYLQLRCARPRFLKTEAKFYDFGSPMRDEICALANEKPCQGPALLIVGGSQGARSLNQIVVEAMPEIAQATGCEIIHIAGAGNEEGIRHGYAECGVAAEVHGFYNKMEECYRRARLVISRSGAGSLAELALAGLPSVQVPLPTAMDDHQTLNARWLEENGGALVLDQNALTPPMLAKQVIRLWQDSAARETMAQAVRRTARPEAAQEIARSIIEMITQRTAATSNE